MGFPLKLRNLKPATCLKDTEVYTTDGIINQRNGVRVSIDTLEHHFSCLLQRYWYLKTFCVNCHFKMHSQKVNSVTVKKDIF